MQVDDETTQYYFSISNGAIGLLSLNSLLILHGEGGLAWLEGN